MTMTHTTHIPVIDIRRIDTDATVLQQVHEACVDWGFFQVVGHSVPPELIDATHASMRAFFALPDADKRGIERTATNSWGFYDRELTKNRRDWKQVFDVGPDEVEGPLAGMTAQWPRRIAVVAAGARSLLGRVRIAEFPVARRNRALSRDASG